jgi:hypothetical protein
MCHINIGMPLRHNDIEDISHLLTHLSTAAQMILTGSAIPDRVRVFYRPPCARTALNKPLAL